MLKNALFKYSVYITAYLSIVGYYLAYEYKNGYFKFYNIPNVYIINVDFIDIIDMVGAIITFFLVGTYFILSHNINNDSEKKTVFRRIKKVLLPIVMLFLIAGYFDIGIIKSASLVFILIILIYNFILPLAFHHKVKGYNEKIDAFFNSEYDMSFIETLQHKLKYQFIQTVIAVILLTYVFGIFINLLGQQNAKKEENFNVAEIDEIKHIIFNVNDEMVVATAVINNKVSDEFFMYSKSDLFIKTEKIKGLIVD